MISLLLSGYKVLSLLKTPSSEAGSIEQADVYVHITFIKKWDICAGDALLTALGNVASVRFYYSLFFRCIGIF